ncbi:hypothetical protein [Brevibacillus brevis]|nr:hypothetical protein [Brevibacillus brevis]
MSILRGALHDPEEGIVYITRFIIAWYGNEIPALSEFLRGVS